MLNIEDILPHVMPYAPGCAEPTAIQQIRDAAVRFCERTRCWRHIATLQTLAEPGDIVVVPAGSMLFELEWISFNGKILQPRTPQVEDYAQDSGAMEPEYVNQVNPGSLNLVPHAAGELVVSMFLKPDASTLQLPDFLVTDFARNLADGALSTLLLIPNQPFTSPQMAAVFENKFQTVMDRNFAINMRGQQRSPKRTRANFM